MQVKRQNFEASALQSALPIRLPSIQSEALKEKLSQLLSIATFLTQKGIQVTTQGLSALFSLAFDQAERPAISNRLSQALSRLRPRGSSRQSTRFLRFFLVVVILGLAIYGINRAIRAITGGGSTQDQRVQIQGPRATLVVNREFQFSLRDDKGEEISQLKYAIESAELRDEIIVKGQRATAVKGRTFLILNLKITNDYSQAIQIPTRNYVRLTRNNNDAELLAPDIHNDPVEVQAISTKLTRVGFPINDSDKNLKLHVGEIDREKQVVDLNFR